jgi:hypothetical protein
LVFVGYVADALRLVDVDEDSVALEDICQFSRLFDVLRCGWLEPRDGLRLLPVIGWLGCSEAIRLFEVVVEPVANIQDLVELPGLEVAVVAEVPGGLKNPEATTGVGVSFFMAKRMYTKTV